MPSGQRNRRVRTLKRIVGIIAMILGAFTTYAMYSRGETGDLRCYGAIPHLLVALGACATVTVVSFRLSRRPVARLAVSFGLSYAAYVLLILGASLITGDFAETMMWLPIILLFAIPFMFPLTAGAIAAVALFASGPRADDG